MTRERSLDRPEHRTAALLGVAAVIVGLSVAAWQSWTCDDAFISYRYAKNLVLGHGLVFNVGERVEGYTNLLWTLWVAVGLRLGAGPEGWTGASGLVCHAVTLVLLLAFHLSLRRRLPVTRATLPVACLAAAVHPDFASFATGGLETAAFTATVCVAYFLLARGLLSGKNTPFLAGIALGLSSTLRPDGVVFAGAAFVALVLLGERKVRVLATFGVTVAAFSVAVTAFRLAYYDAWFPNTYYAKSAYLTWHSQGLVYLYSYLHKYWVLFAGAGFAAFALRRPSTLALDEDGERFFRVHVTLSALFALFYGYYVVRVGGDFMYARLLIPVTPYLAILLELGLYRFSRSRPVAYLELVALALGLMLLTPRPVTDADWLSGIADERGVYSDKRVVEDARKSEILARFFRGLPVRLAFLGTEARVMYEADIPVAIEADTGLTDRTIARQPLAKRGRIGHEKRASVPYLVGTRAAHFLFAPRGPEELGLSTYIPVLRITLGTLDGFILHWDDGMMRDLRARGASFQDFPEYLDQYIQGIGSRPRADVARDYERFRLFYFDHQKDDRRKAAFEARLAQP
ncbi:MAG TPA: hypothetical protein VHE30_20765 [Polyangiaceae bacterium]|nr:hypothetical protein [Polyangiaceae bacterium]